MSLIEYGLTLMLYGVGFYFVQAFTGRERLLRSLAAAFPIGCGLWAVGVFLAALLPFVPKDGYGVNLPAAFVFMFAMLMGSRWFAVERQRLSDRELGILLVAGLVLSVLYGFVMWLNVSILTGDSLRHVHPQFGFRVMAHSRGFNQTLAVLARMAGQDRYFFAYHGLFAVSMLILFVECAYHEIRSVSGKRRSVLFAASSGALLLASCHMSAIQAVYVNNHMLVATLLIWALSLWLGITRRPEGRYARPTALLGAIGISFLGLLRMEGQLVGILFLVTMSGRPGLPTSFRTAPALLFAVLTTPVMLMMVVLNWSGEDVSASPFALMLAITWLLPVFFVLKSPAVLRHLQAHAGGCVVAVLAGGVGWSLYTKADRMTVLFTRFLTNAFDVSYWGFTHHLLVVLLPLLFIMRRVIFRDRPGRGAVAVSDGLLSFHVGALFSLFLIFNFHGVRIGWSDSTNRMLFHFFPVAVLWVTIQAGLGFCATAVGGLTEEGRYRPRSFLCRDRAGRE